ncbi:TonB-dependent receptor [Rhodocaloribacter litoris]|uniref:SusC/RagA family TonB-linked outer membrane protein n=1 Tax=Rhodocaloribacter litoris TaxID=2558931 RepID=UPI00142214C0|nr:TonB-dependent receptor [Rhodocaloribacter litoris]QXD16586.1 TonB-dependent receptor [Rhodocaloribacter litoris]
MVKKILLLSTLMLCCVSLAFAQRTITGTVTDADSGLPLPGVNIAIKGTMTGTTTDINGQYRIQANQGDVLVFSFVGYLTQEVPVGTQDVIDVALAVDEVLLDEVVVVGYGTQRRANVTGSAERVNADEANVGLVSAPEQLIQGRVAGVNIIQNGGEPGAPTTVRIRGGTSISASNEPLYVIDGVPIDNAGGTPGLLNEGGNTPSSGRKNPLVFLNPNDIESIDVLKDASAAAIYGSRGANGVILITTKKGRAGQVQVDYDGYVSTSNFARKLDLLTAEEYWAAVRFYGLPEDNLGNADTDWQEAVTRDAVSHQHNLAFGGGTSATQYRASVSYLKQEGIIIDSGLERVSGRINVNHSAFDDRLRIDTRLTGSFFNDNRAPFNQTGGFEGGLLTNVMKYNPTLPVRRADGTFFEIPGQTSVRNPVAMAEQVDDIVKTTRLLGSFKADYDFTFITEGLTGTVNLGLDRQQASRRYFIPGANPLKQAVNGEAQQSNREQSSQLIELYGTYARLFGDAHNVSLVGGYSFQEFLQEGFQAMAQGFVTDLFEFNNLAAGNSETFSISSFKQKNRLISFFGRLNYDYRGRYILSASLRRDGSSRFGADEKWGFFPAFTLGWRLSDESFLQGVEAISDLKLRVGWGVTGSQEIGNLRSLPIFGSAGNAVLGEQEVSGVAPTNFPNPDLKWEETTQFNVGLDFDLWDSRVYGSVEYYVKNTDDLLLEFEVPQPAAVPTRLANAGEMKNTGVDVALNAVVLDRGDLFLEFGATFNRNKNEIENLGGRTQIFTGRASGAGLSQLNTQILTPGEPFGTFFGPEFIGFDPQTGIQLCRGAQTQSAPCSDIGQAEWLIIGSAQPDFTYGLTTNLTYKNWDFSFFIRGEQGRDVFNNTALEYSSKNLLNTNVNFLRQALEDPTPLAEAPQYSSRWIQDASFLRMENITLGYTFRNVTSLNALVGTIRRARIYVSANNLFVITPYDGFDPEVNTEASSSVGNIPILSLGIDYTNYPRPRTFTAGISLGF